MGFSCFPEYKIFLKREQQNCQDKGYETLDPLMAKSKLVHQCEKCDQIEGVAQCIYHHIGNECLRDMALVAESPVFIEHKGQADTHGIQQGHRGLMPHSPLGNQKIDQE